MTLGELHRQEIGVTRCDVEGEDLLALVDQAKAADPEAWERLYRRAYPGLMAYATRRLGTDRGRDAVAETMARAIAGIDRFAWKGSGFDGWLYGILRHVVLDAHRAQDRDRSRPGQQPDGAAALPLDHVLHGEEADALRAAFAALDSSDRELLEMRVVAGLSAEDTAAALGKRPGAVRMAQSRALARLRQELEKRS